MPAGYYQITILPMETPTKDELARLLSTWEIKPKSNPGFRAAVWAKIEAIAPEPRTWGAWLRMNVGTVAPLALAVITFSVVGGGLVAKAKASVDREIMIERYLTSIDPHRQTDTIEPR